jgi:hypothetical protein
MLILKYNWIWIKISLFKNWKIANFANIAAGLTV